MCEDASYIICLLADRAGLIRSHWKQIQSSAKLFAQSLHGLGTTQWASKLN